MQGKALPRVRSAHPRQNQDRWFGSRFVFWPVRYRRLCCLLHRRAKTYGRLFTTADANRTRAEAMPPIDPSLLLGHVLHLPGVGRPVIHLSESGPSFR